MGIDEIRKKRDIKGEHYLKYKIDPLDFAMENNLNACQTKVVKYVTRYKDKGGGADLDKAINILERLKKYEGYD